MSICNRMEITSIFIILLELIHLSPLFLVNLFLFENLTELISQGNVFSKFLIGERAIHLIMIE